MLSYFNEPELVEEKAKKVYELLKDLSEVEDYPALQNNSRQALAAVWQIMNHLDLEFEQLYHLNV